MPRIYVACLASYNNGVLHGAWIDAVQDADALQAEVATMLRASPYPNVTVDCPNCGCATYALVCRERELARQSAEAKELAFVRGRQVRFRGFVELVARMQWDGEERADGTVADVPNDDNHDTIISLIENAREIAGDIVVKGA